MEGFSPLLATGANLDAIDFPALASPKLDGIRAFSGVLTGLSSRTLKSIPNRAIQNWAASLPPYLDGELLTYTNGVRDDFNTVQSKVMSHEGTPDFRFHVFDCFRDPAAPFRARLREAEIAILGRDRLRLVPHVELSGLDALMAFEREAVETHRWEGIMLRHPDGRYKMGRSTAREGILLKVKRFDDAEARIVGFQEEVGSVGGVPLKKGTLGALHVMWGDTDFSIGTGFTAEQRADFWRTKDTLEGKTVTFRYWGVGSQGRPRFPAFAGLRYDLAAE